MGDLTYQALSNASKIAKLMFLSRFLEGDHCVCIKQKTFIASMSLSDSRKRQNIFVDSMGSTRLCMVSELLSTDLESAVSVR